MTEHRLLFVCLGNTCRSPMAEGIFRQLLDDRGRLDEFVLDSAGLGYWHVGEPPNPRARQVAARHGVDISALRARQVVTTDFREFDQIVAMDVANLAQLRRLAPISAAHKLGLLLDFSSGFGPREVPDPYHGDVADYEAVFTTLREACAELLIAIDAHRLVADPSGRMVG